MQRKSKWNGVVTVMTLLLMAFGTLFAAPPTGTTRPIQQFLDAQGTFCTTGVDCGFDPDPGTPRFLGWDNLCIGGSGLLAFVDYAGKTGTNLSPTFSGEVTEQPLESGGVEVKVTLRTKNTLTWAISACTLVPAFGYKPSQVSSSATAALGDSFLEATFINSAQGEPLPDLMEFLWGDRTDTLSLYFHAAAKGELRSPAGEKGKLTVDQICTVDFGILNCTTQDISLK